MYTEYFSRIISTKTTRKRWLQLWNIKHTEVNNGYEDAAWWQCAKYDTKFFKDTNERSLHLSDRFWSKTFASSLFCVLFEVSTVWFSLKFVWIIFILDLILKERHSLTVSMWVCVLHTLCQAWSGAAGRRRPAHSSRRWWSWWSSPRGSSWWPRGTRPAGTGLRWASLPEPDSGQDWAAGRGGGQRKRFWI